MKPKLCQASTELMILLFIIMGLFLVMLSVSSSREDQLRGIKEYLSAKDIGDSVAWNINSAIVGGYGNRRALFIPAKLSDNTVFNLTVDAAARYVIIEWGSRYYTAPLLTSSIAGNTTLVQGRVNITNVLGVIEVAE